MQTSGGSHTGAERPAGYAALLTELGIDYTPTHQTWLSNKPFGAMGLGQGVECDVHGRERTVMAGRTALQDTPGGHLLFALKHDGVDLEALRLICARLEPREIEQTVRAQPNSTHARRLWFLHEWLTGKTLDVPPLAGRPAHVPLFDPARYWTCDQGRSQRHGILYNGLGDTWMCPVVRRSAALQAYAAQRPLEQLDQLVSGLDPALTRRIDTHLHVAESKGSFAIEGITATSSDDEVFFTLINGLVQQPRPAIDRTLLHKYQNLLIEGDSRETSGAYRQHQVWIGERKGYTPMPHYIAPRAQDVPTYMDSVCAMANTLGGQARAGEIDPVIAGAVTSAAFVYVHPFMDGNGRLSRLLLQQALTRDPDADGRRLLVPISAVIHRHREDYYAHLNVWSAQLMGRLRYTERDGGVEPEGETRDLYRFPDLTRYAEFIYRAAGEGVTTDIPQEAAALAAYDRAAPLFAAQGLNERQAALFFAIAKDNGWRISKRKRDQFPQLSDDQVDQIETALAPIGLHQDNDRTRQIR